MYIIHGIGYYRKSEWRLLLALGFCIARIGDCKSTLLYTRYQLRKQDIFSNPVPATDRVIDREIAKLTNRDDFIARYITDHARLFLPVTLKRKIFLCHQK